MSSPSTITRTDSPRWRFPAILAVAMLSPMLIGVPAIGGWAYFQFGSWRSASAFLRGDQFVLDPPVLDVGRLHEGEIKTLKVWAVNLTGEPIDVNGGMSYCAEKICLGVVTSDLPMSVPPRSRRALGVVVDTSPRNRAQRGPFRNNTHIHTQIGDLTLTVTGERVK